MPKNSSEEKSMLWYKLIDILKDYCSQCYGDLKKIWKPLKNEKENDT